MAAADANRGRELYELHCLGCHGQSVHGRATRKARSFEEVRGWVARWNDSLSLRWSAEDVDDVTLHLNTLYYRYPCPPSTCKVVSQAGHEGALIQIKSGGLPVDKLARR